MSEAASGYLCPLYCGDRVVKEGGDYTFDGIVVAVFTKFSGHDSEMNPQFAGPVRFVAQNDQGILHIFSRKNLRKI